MKPPTPNDITAALDAIEASERPVDHARTIARERVKEWRSNAERERLPITNVHDDKGAPVLMRDEVVRASVPNHAEPAVKTRRGWWARLFRGRK